jgi:hypothetical protein
MVWGASVTADNLPPQPEQTGPVRKRVDWRVRGGIAAAFLVAGIVLLAEDWWLERASPKAGLRGDIAASFQESVEAHALRLERTYGIRIGYGNPADFWAPPFKPEDATAPWINITPADPRDVAISLNGIEAALQQYPSGFVAKLIKAVFIGGELRMQGELASGTAGAAWVIISASPDYGPEGLREAGFLGLHHELSSFVLRVDPRTRLKWEEFAPVGWHFAEDAGGALRRAETTDPSPNTGFLDAYGATTLENDFNVYAEEMFGNPDKVAHLAREHPLIRRKLDFVMETYVAIDPELRALFRKRGLGE